MIIKTVNIEKFRAFGSSSFDLGKRITVISGRNATQKTTILGMIGQPFTISNKNSPMYGCRTIDGYNFRSQFKEKFKISQEHDVIGEHKWSLKLHRNIYDRDSFSIESIARKQSGRRSTLRFWNSESRARGAGYIQLPVYFLSLGRLFPIGETGKTKPVPMELSPEELQYCIDNYRNILSIHNLYGETTIGIEKSSTSKTFSGISDGMHDIFTNSAGEGNITRIILAILSFKRLKDKYGRDYRGGLLLIDELDATLYGFSQIQLVEYLWKAANDYKIQIVFTTHSPLILKAVNKFQRIERQRKGMNLPAHAYDSAIVYLEPDYDGQGRRFIKPRNVLTSNELNVILDDINLKPHTNDNKINIYCEDELACSFLKFILHRKFDFNLDLYMFFVGVNLGWTNYVQLAEKEVPEFRENMIVLDGDVPFKPEYKSKKQSIESSGNFLFLPLVIEKDIFGLLKDYSKYNKFSSCYIEAKELKYDICFNHWPLEKERYDTRDFKEWYSQTVSVLGNQEVLFSFWCDEHSSEVDLFLDKFTELYNRLADNKDVDLL